MDWIDILQNRQQTFLWSDKVPERELIETILDELHTHCPSKQNNIPYKIQVLDWSNKDKRIEIFKDTWCDNDDINDRRNPQVLAPYLFLFSGRDINFTVEEDTYANLEVGLASMFISLSAVNHGLDYGFCACHNSEEVYLSIGVGYADPNYVSPKKGRFYNPLLDKQVWLSSIDDPKPDKSVYIQFD